MRLVGERREYPVGLLTRRHLNGINRLEVLEGDFGVVFVLELHENGRDADLGCEDEKWR